MKNNSKKDASSEVSNNNIKNNAVAQANPANPNKAITLVALTPDGGTASLATVLFPEDSSSTPKKSKLSPEEESSLVRLEQVIERGLATFVEVGAALHQIQSQRLYGTLSGYVLFPYPFPPDIGAFVRGPAAPGEVGAILFSLGQQQKAVPSPPYSWGSTFYTTHLALTTAQEDELKAGLWYIEISTQSHPGGEVRGQILLVPEPPSAALGVVGGGLLWCWSVRRRVRKGAVAR